MNYAGWQSTRREPVIFCMPYRPAKRQHRTGSVGPLAPESFRGLCASYRGEPAVEETKEIAALSPDLPQISPTQMELARWISDTILPPPLDALP